MKMNRKPISLTPAEVINLFHLSVVNGAEYREPEPVFIKFPSDTWFQRRQREVAEGKRERE